MCYYWLVKKGESTMKRFHKGNTSKKNFAKGSPYQRREKKRGSKNNSVSAYIRISLVHPRSEESQRKEYIANGGYLPPSKPKYDDYILEFDNHADSQPHFHIWRANGNSKVSDTRSAGIFIGSTGDTGLEHTSKERKNEVKLNATQTKQVFEFLQENKLLLFCYYEALKQGKTKEFPGLDETFACSLFDDREFYRLAEKYKRLTGEKIPAEFGE